MRHHSRGDKRQRVEDAGLTVGRIAAVKLLHRFTVSESARAMIELVSILVKNFYRRDVVSLTLSLCADALCLFDGVRSLLQLCRGRRRPDGMVVAHGNAPVTHATSRIGDGNFAKRLFSLFILERMEPGDGAIEFPLCLGITGDREVDLPELF